MQRDTVFHGSWAWHVDLHGPPSTCRSATKTNGAAAPVQQPSVRLVGLLRAILRAGEPAAVSAVMLSSQAAMYVKASVITPALGPNTPLQMTMLSALPLALIRR